MDKQNDRRLWYAIGAVLILLILCSCCCLGCGFLWWAASRITVDNSITPIPDRPTQEPGSMRPPREPQVPIVVDPLPDEAMETLNAILESEIPVSDMHDLGIRYLGVPSNTPRIASATNPDYPVGTERTFNAHNLDTERQFTITAVLAYKTAHVYMWVEKGARVNQKDIEEAADLFESHTYPTNREFFGSEPNPGIDGDPHLNILHANGLGYNIAGYFSSTDQYVREVRPDSNQMEMFYINLENVKVGDAFYNGVLAHEFQHMIHWYRDRNETTWLNEGCSEMAMALNDRSYHRQGVYDVGGSDYAYILQTDTQLTNWPEEDDTSAHYGAAYLFMEYFLDRFGEDATKDLVSHPENGMKSVDLVLQDQIGPLFTHKHFFSDWIVANLLDDSKTEGGRYGYAQIDPLTPDASTTVQFKGSPVELSGSVSQYGVDYIEVNGSDPVTVTFTGATQVKLLDTVAYSGKYLWWSNREDESNTRLTRLLDLTDARTAALSFQTWYHIEDAWDYAYVAVGYTADGAIPDDINSPEIQWQLLTDPGLQCNHDNPNGNNYGCGLTGRSNGWVLRQVDLSAYAGRTIAIRFEYITDAAVNQPGLALDDITLTVDGNVQFSDNAETEDPAWIAEGFVRHANVLPQEWILRAVLFGRDNVAVTDLLQWNATSGSWRLPMNARNDRAILVVAALAPVTTEKASYQITLLPAN